MRNNWLPLLLLPLEAFLLANAAIFSCNEGGIGVAEGRFACSSRALRLSVIAVESKGRHVAFHHANCKVEQRKASRQSSVPPTAKLILPSFSFDLPSPETKLGVVRQIVADYTHLPRDAFKLIHAGAIMKDDNAPSMLGRFFWPRYH